MNQTAWIQNEDDTYRCTRCGVPSFSPGISSCSCPPAGGSDANAPKPGSDRAESRFEADSGDTGLPAGGLSYWESALARIELEQEQYATAVVACDEELREVASLLRNVAKDLDRDRALAIELKYADDMDVFMCQRDSIRLRKDVAVAQKDVLKEARATIIARKDVIAAASKASAEASKQVRAGYEMAKARDQERLVLIQERMVEADALIRAGQPEKALAVLGRSGGDAN